MRRLAAEGLSEPEIAWRFRCSPAHVRRTLRWSEIPRTSRPKRMPWRSTALERTVLKARARGATHAEIAAKLRRTPEFVTRVEGLARFRTQKEAST